MKKNILVVDDSALMRRIICDIINSDDRFQAIDYARDGLDAYEKIKRNRYDVMMLDINMPKMDGLQLLERMQKEGISLKVIVVSTLTTAGADVAIRAVDLGAIDFLTKPDNVIEAKGHAFHDRLIGMLSGVFQAEERPVTHRTNSFMAASMKRSSEQKHRTRQPGGRKLIALACSTGGPKALQSVIPKLNPNMDAPMVLVQHMPVGFTKSMAERLNEISKVEVKEAEEGDVLQKGYVYVAPGGKHLEVVCGSDGVHKVHLNDAPPIGGLKPCANVMYRSLTKSRYDEIVCVVLTGMGADGTEGIVQLDKVKSVHVIAQDEATCVVYGMPRAIAEAGMVDEVVPLESIANTINNKVGVK